MVLVRVHVTRRRERAARVRVDELRDSASFHGRQVIIGRQVGDGAVEQPPRLVPHTAKASRYASRNPGSGMLRESGWMKPSRP